MAYPLKEPKFKKRRDFEEDPAENLQKKPEFNFGFQRPNQQAKEYCITESQEDREVMSLAKWMGGPPQSSASQNNIRIKQGSTYAKKPMAKPLRSIKHKQAKTNDQKFIINLNKVRPRHAN